MTLGEGENVPIEYKQLQNMVQESGLHRVVFSVFDTVSHDGPEWMVTNNLDNIAARGRVRFTYLGHESQEIENPTWMDVCMIADHMIGATGDHHHVFLEGVRDVGAGKYALIMGS